jgi:carbonic anhydrase
MRHAVVAFILLLSFGLFAQNAKHGTDAAAPESTAKSAAAATASNQVWADLLAGNKRYREGKPLAHNYPAERSVLVKGQEPKVAILSCSDSRVPPELVFDKSLGELFVVRTAGNSADALAIGSLEYGVEHLGTKVLLVMGHQSCGAVSAACSGEKAPTENLEAVVAPIAPACRKAGTTLKGAELIDAAVHENVQNSAQNLLAKSQVLQHAVHEGKLTIIEAYYRLDTGEVVRLK